MGIVEREEKPSSIVDRRTVNDDPRMCVFVDLNIYLYHSVISAHLAEQVGSNSHSTMTITANNTIAALQQQFAVVSPGCSQPPWPQYKNFGT